MPNICFYVLYTCIKPDPTCATSLRLISPFLSTSPPSPAADELFLELEATPLGAASLAQCHRGVLRDGRVVAVKIQHPDVGKNAYTDMETMEVDSCVAVSFPDRILGREGLGMSGGMHMGSCVTFQTLLDKLSERVEKPRQMGPSLGFNPGPSKY